MMMIQCPMHPEESWHCQKCIELDAKGISSEADYQRGLLAGIKQERERCATVHDPYDTPGIEWHCQDAPRSGTKLYTSQHDPALAEICRDLVAWTKNYPSSRIYNESEIRRIAKEIDAISERAAAALGADK
jgi:hypothetical protein